MRVSHMLPSRAAGATIPSDTATVTAIYSSEPAPTTKPITGQCVPSSTVAPASIITDGSSAISTVSFSRSSAQIPRVILRTVEPAKLFACQSVEKRCTRWNDAAAISLIIFSVSVMMFR